MYCRSSDWIRKLSNVGLSFLFVPLPPSLCAIQRLLYNNCAFFTMTSNLRMQIFLRFFIVVKRTMLHIGGNGTRGKRNCGSKRVNCSDPDPGSEQFTISSYRLRRQFPFPLVPLPPLLLLVSCYCLLLFVSFYFL